MAASDTSSQEYVDCIDYRSTNNGQGIPDFFSRLPAELTSQIFENCSTSTLKCFRLCSKLCAELVEPILFKLIVLFPHQQRFEQLLSLSKHERLARHVQQIRYDLSWAELMTSHTHADYDYEGTWWDDGIDPIDCAECDEFLGCQSSPDRHHYNFLTWTCDQGLRPGTHQQQTLYDPCCERKILTEAFRGFKNFDHFDFWGHNWILDYNNPHKDADVRQLPTFYLRWWNTRSQYERYAKLHVSYSPEDIQHSTRLRNCFLALREAETKLHELHLYHYTVPLIPWTKFMVDQFNYLPRLDGVKDFHMISMLPHKQTQRLMHKLIEPAHELKYLEAEFEMTPCQVVDTSCGKDRKHFMRESLTLLSRWNTFMADLARSHRHGRWTAKLETARFHNLITRQGHFLQFLRVSAPTLRSLKLQDCVLMGRSRRGAPNPDWRTVIKFMTAELQLSKVEFKGQFVALHRHQFWRVKPSEDSKTLYARVRDFVLSNGGGDERLFPLDNNDIDNGGDDTWKPDDLFADYEFDPPDVDTKSHLDSGPWALNAWT